MQLFNTIIVKKKLLSLYMDYSALLYLSETIYMCLYIIYAQLFLLNRIKILLLICKCSFHIGLVRLLS